MKSLSLQLVLSALLLLTASAVVANAQQVGSLDVPRMMSYQGLLTSSDGTALPNGTYDITVTLYADEAGTQLLWKNTYTTLVLNGIFNLILGAGDAPLPDPAQMNRPLWVGTAINGSDRMTPLSPLTSSPYAMNVPDNAVTTNKLADGAVTAEKMGTPYVAGLSLNGKSITGDGTVLNIEVGDGIALTYDEVTRTLRLSKPVADASADGEKGASVLAGTATDTVWSISGDAWDVGGTSYEPGNNDWIGTSANANFTIKVNNSGSVAEGRQRIMQYQPNNTSANILGGHNTNFIGNGAGNIIAGGGHNGGSHRIENGSIYGVIGGGDTNLITNAADYATIGGGEKNRIDSDHGFIGGGDSNAIRSMASESTISGGDSNIIDEFTNNATIGGGEQNYIGQDDDWSTIAGGHGGIITDQHGFIGGGHFHTIGGNTSTIGGGWVNKVNGDKGFIGGGENNYIDSNHGAIGGGYRDTVSGLAGFIGAGRNNRIDGLSSVIGGGDTNLIRTGADYGFIGGGWLNEIISTGGTIAGGTNNLIDVASSWSFIGGGDSDTIKNSSWAVIAGGHENRISSSTAINYSTIGGGDSNLITNEKGTIGGGYGNVVSNANGTIGGGRWNFVSGITGTIAGGFQDTVAALEGTIAGGSSNSIASGATQSAIGGGTANKIASGNTGSTIGGGVGNRMATGSRSAIPGGEFLLAQGYGQTVLGFFNEYKGSMPFRKVGATLAQKNLPILIIGNGDTIQGSENRSNAFEVSYNGHSIVFDENGTGGAAGGGGRGVVQGGTYTDNVIYAWAEVEANGTLKETCDDFGVADIDNLAAGIYRVTLNPVGPDGSSQLNISCGAVVATIATEWVNGGGDIPIYLAECFFIRTTNIVNNQFDVLINNLQGDCHPQNHAFKFHVTARP